jgi:hypothetical protein
MGSVASPEAILAIDTRRSKVCFVKVIASLVPPIRLQICSGRGKNQSRRLVREKIVLDYLIIYGDSESFDAAVEVLAFNLTTEDWRSRNQ